MKSTPSTHSAGGFVARWQRRLAAGVLGLLAVLSLAAGPAAWAAPVGFFLPYQGSGNLSVFGSVGANGSGSGGWVGSIDPVPPPDGNPAFVSVVDAFAFDAATLGISGRFEFTRASDLGASIFGRFTGLADGADFLTAGGLLTLDYAIAGGSGDYTDAHGFGTAFLRYDPRAAGDNYSEIGVFVFDVPEPASAALAGLVLALAVMASQRRRKA